MKLIISAALIIILGCFQNCNTEVASLKIFIPENYTGWAYVLEKVNPHKEINNECFLDSKGIAYINPEFFNKDFKPVFIKSNKELTKEDIKLIFKTEINLKNSKIKDALIFYILNKEEIKKGSSFWKSEENRRPIRQGQYSHLDSLIKNQLINSD